MDGWLLLRMQRVGIGLALVQPGCVASFQAEQKMCVHELCGGCESARRGMATT